MWIINKTQLKSYRQKSQQNKSFQLIEKEDLTEMKKYQAFQVQQKKRQSIKFNIFLPKNEIQNSFSPQHRKVYTLIIAKASKSRPCHQTT